MACVSSSDWYLGDFLNLQHVGNSACDEYPTMHYFRIPRRTQSMIAYEILFTSS